VTQPASALGKRVWKSRRPTHSGVMVMRTTEEIKLRKWLTSPGPDPARNIVPPLRQKAGVGGSTPSLATMFFSDLADRPEISHL
jgi:hypothetical protein